MPLTLDELTARLVRCIGIWETNRGGNDPAPESQLKTVCGVPASMATIEQATMPYAVNAMLAYSGLQGLANPELTVAELKEARNHCAAIKSLLEAIADAVNEGQSSADFMANEKELIQKTSLDGDDVTTMFRARLLATVKKLHDDFVQKTNGLDEQKDREKIRKISRDLADTVPLDDRLGLGDSLATYVRRPGIWGENRAGWQRKSVNAMPGQVGARIQQVAESAHGTGLAFPVSKDRLTKVIDGGPIPQDKPSLKPIVVNAAQLNNPNEKDYGLNVWEKNYDRLFP